MKLATSAITQQTRRESNQKTDRKTLQAEILKMLREETALTARECAAILCSKGFIPYPERAMIQPRLTELVQDGKIEVCGKTFDAVTSRTVAVYKAV